MLPNFTPLSLSKENVSSNPTPETRPPAGQTTGPDSTQSLNEEMERENPDLQFRTSMRGH